MTVSNARGIKTIYEKLKTINERSSKMNAKLLLERLRVAFTFTCEESRIKELLNSLTLVEKCLSCRSTSTQLLYIHKPPLHNRYSILSDTALSEIKCESEDNSLELYSIPTKQQQAKRRKADKVQLTTKNQEKPKNESSSSVLAIGDSIPKHIDGLTLQQCSLA